MELHSDKYPKLNLTFRRYRDADQIMSYLEFFNRDVRDLVDHGYNLVECAVWDDNTLVFSGWDSIHWHDYRVISMRKWFNEMPFDPELDDFRFLNSKRVIARSRRPQGLVIYEELSGGYTLILGGSFHSLYGTHDGFNYINGTENDCFHANCVLLTAIDVILALSWKKHNSRKPVHFNV